MYIAIGSILDFSIGEMSHTYIHKRTEKKKKKLGDTAEI